MKKYKQNIIPSVRTFRDENNKVISNKRVLPEFLKCFYKDNIQGKTITNQHLCIPIYFGNEGMGKISRGSSIDEKKSAVLQCLPLLTRIAKYNNFGQRKAKDGQDVIGYLNFSAKVLIDGQLESVRIAVKLRSNNKAYYQSFYNHTVSRKP